MAHYATSLYLLPPSLSDGEKVLVLYQRGEQPQDEDLAGLQD